VRKNVADALVPLFTDTEIDSVLVANGAPPWDRGQSLLGLFALKSTGVPLGDALVSFATPPGGTLVQTGQGKDPIVVVNAAVGATSFSLARSGYVWDGPYAASLRPGIVTVRRAARAPELQRLRLRQQLERIAGRRCDGGGARGADVGDHDHELPRAVSRWWDSRRDATSRGSRRPASCRR
jgi:hypothetical protein